MASDVDRDNPGEKKSMRRSGQALSLAAKHVENVP